MKSFLTFKADVLKLFEEGLAFAQKTEYPSVAENIKKIKDNFEKKEFTIVTCGEIKRGKSSLLTAFLEEKGLFPINMNVATNTVTIVRYGAEEKIEVVMEDNGNFETKSILRDEIAEYVTEQGNKNNDKNVNCLNIRIPNPKLKDGLVFVDTPGVGSLNFSHSEVTYGFLPNADVVLFVSDVLAPLTEPELKFLETAYRYCRNIVYPLTKIDKIPNYNEISATNRESISKRTGVQENEIKVVPVSSAAKLNYMDSKNKMMLNNSKFLELEKIIWELITDKKAEIMILPSLHEFAKELSLLGNNLKIAFSSLVQENKEEMKRMEEEFKKLQEEKKKLLNEGAEWKQQLSFELSRLSSEISTTIQDRRFSIDEHIESLVKKGKLSKERIEEIQGIANDEIIEMAYDVKNNISDNVNDLIDKIYDDLKLSLNVNADASNIDLKLETSTVKIQEGRLSNTLIQGGRSVAMKISGAAMVSGLAVGLLGATIGFFAAGPVGALFGAQQGGAWGAALGGAAGTVKGVIDGVKYRGDDQAGDIVKQFARYTARKATELQNISSSTSREMGFLIQKELSEKIKYQLETLERNTSDINNNAQLSKDEAEKRAKQLRPQLDTVRVLEEHLADCLEQVKQVKADGEPDKENQAVSLDFLSK